MKLETPFRLKPTVMTNLQVAQRPCKLGTRPRERARVRHRAILRNDLRALTRTFAQLAALVLFVSSAAASTITGNIRNTSGNAYATNALFTPLSTPQADGANIIASTPTNVVAAADGSFSVVLKQGNYKVNIGNVPADTILIAVPNDSATYNINSLIVSQVTYSFPVSPIYEQKVNKGTINGYAGLNSSGLIPLAQLGAGAANGYFLGTDGSIASWQPPPVPYLYDSAQFTLVNNTNVAIRKAASLTNLVLYSSGVGPALALASGAGVIITNGNFTLKGNSLLTVGDGTGTPQLRFESGASASDYTGTESWNFKTTIAGGRDAATVARISDITNGLTIASQDGFGTNIAIYASVNTNVPLSIVGAANHATNLLEIRNSSGAIVGCISSNGFYRSQYDFVAQLTTTDNTTNTIYAFTPANNSVVRVYAQVVGWNSTASAGYGRVGLFKNVSGTVTQIGALAAVGLGEEDAAYEALMETASNQVRIRVAGNTGRTVNWIVYGNIFYAP